MGRTHSVSDRREDKAEGVRTGALCVAEAWFQVGSWACEEAGPVRGPLMAEGVGMVAAQGRLCGQ